MISGFSRFTNMKNNPRRLALTLCLSAFTLVSTTAQVAFAKGELLESASQLSANPLGVVDHNSTALAGAALAVNGAKAPPGLSEGAGIWVNLWNYPKNDFEGYAEKLYASGIRNLFIQTSRSNTPAIGQPTELGLIIEACHKYKIRVIAWSFAELHNTKADADKLIYAAKFRTPSGDRLDAIAPNLEKNLNKQAVEAYSTHLRQALGANYPMVAVVYSPLNRAPQVAITPWKTLAKYYDVIAPMAYWNGRYQTVDAYNYTKRTVERIRELTERPDVEVHVIGDGMGTRAREIKEFLRACGDAGAQSASLYPNQQTTVEQYGAMSLYDDYMPLNARERLTMVRHLMQQGLMSRPGKYDPSKALPRGDLFLLTAAALKVPNVQDASSAYEYFRSSGVIEATARQYPEIALDGDLSAPLSIDTAQDFVAQAKRAQLQPKGGHNHKNRPSYLTMSKPSRADRLFAAPAYAGARSEIKGLNLARGVDGSRNLNYFEAAELFSQISR